MSGTTNLLGRRFDELQKQAAAIEEAKRPYRSEYCSDKWEINENDANRWIVSAEHLIETAAGGSSAHFKAFVAGKAISGYESDYGRFNRLRTIFEAAKDDFEGGYLTTLRAIVQAEVYDSELDQARGLLAAGYPVPAAVIAGVVLETAVRQLCVNRGIADGKLDKMNADLCKAGLYTLLVQKRITALADIRNNAAHGHPEKFNRDDVDDMIRQVERFLADYPA